MVLYVLITIPNDESGFMFFDGQAGPLSRLPQWREGYD